MKCAKSTTSSMGNAPMAKGASTCMPAVLAGAHTQQRGATAVRVAQPKRVDIPQREPEVESACEMTTECNEYNEEVLILLIA